MPDDGLQERGEFAALELAAECDVQVLVRDAQTYTSRSFAQPDGSIASEFYAEPQWVPDAAGEWVDVDPTVTVAEDGTLHTVATVSDLEFGTAGDTAFLTATNVDGEQVTLTWGAPLPEPVIEGSVVTYPEVLPEVDLEVYAGTVDFSYALVVKSPEAAENAVLEQVELGIDVVGLTVDADTAADTALLTDEGGDAAFSVAQPWMWDSSQSDMTSSPEQAAPMDLEIDSDSLTVFPDQELLADPATEYPVYIDPEFTDTTASTEEVFSERTGISCGTTNELCVGAQTWQADDALGYWRSAIRFNGLNSIVNRDVWNATVLITQTHTGDAGGPNQTVRLYSMDYFDMSGSVSFSSFADKFVQHVASDSVPTSNTGANEDPQRIKWADDKIGTRIQLLLNNGGDTATFAMLSGSNTDQEANRDYFRKLDAGSAKLTVWHGPLKPTQLLVDDTSRSDDTPSCSTSAPGPTINTLTPKLKATAPSDLEADNRVSFYLYDRYDTHPGHKQQIDFEDVADGAPLTGTVAAGMLERGKTYRWNARAQDSDGSSSGYGEFTSYCYFNVNSLPNVPTSLSTQDSGCGTQTNPTVVSTTTPKLSSVPSDPDEGTVWARYRFYAETGDNLKQWRVQVPSGTPATTPVATGLVTGDGLYRWRVTTDDAFTTSASEVWSNYCWLRVDTTAPEPPDVAQVSENPLPGDTVRFQLLGGPDVQSFEYSVNGVKKEPVSAVDGQAEIHVSTAASGSIDHVLKVWARDFPKGSTGNTSSPTTHLFTLIEAQPAQAVGAWRFDGDLLDDAADDELAPKTVSMFGADAAGRTDAVATFDGTGANCLKADGPVVNTTDSFTLGGWVKFDQAPAAEAAIMDITGVAKSNFKVVLSAAGRFGIAMISSDDAAGASTVVYTPATATEYGTWTHVATVYDAAAERIRVYVNGELLASKAVTFEPWEAVGLFSVGCGTFPSGGTFSPFTGSVDDAAAFQEALTAEQIKELMSGEAMPAGLQAWYPLRHDPETTPGADYSGRGTMLGSMPQTPVWDADQHGRKQSAMIFDGATCPATGTSPVRTDAAFSVSAWVKLDSDHAAQHPLVFSFYGGQTYSAALKYNWTTDTWEFFTRESDTVDARYSGVPSSTPALKDVWTHLTAVFEPETNQLLLYVNGEWSGSRSLSYKTWRADGLALGCNNGATGTFAGWEGAISDFRVWRGALDADEVAATHTQQLAAWELGETTAGNDEWGANHLTVTGTLGTDYSWETDRYNDCYAAYGLALGGTSYAFTASPVVTTDESFTVTAWARVDNLDDFRTIVSQTGTTYGAFNLSYNPVLDRFQLSMPQQDAEKTGWTRVLAKTAPVIDESTGLGKWYHLAAQVDLGAGVIRLYVDGVLQGEAPVVESPWKATGSLTIGAAEQFGVMKNFMVGGIDQAQVWGGALDRLSIEALAANRPQVELDPNEPDCTGSEPPPPVDL